MNISIKGNHSKIQKIQNLKRLIFIIGNKNEIQLRQ